MRLAHGQATTLQGAGGGGTYLQECRAYGARREDAADLKEFIKGCYDTVNYPHEAFPAHVCWLIPLPVFICHFPRHKMDTSRLPNHPNHPFKTILAGFCCNSIIPSNMQNYESDHRAKTIAILFHSTTDISQAPTQAPAKP